MARAALGARVLLLGLAALWPVSAVASIAATGNAHLDARALPALPSGLEELERPEQRRAACGVFCGPRLATSLEVGVGWRGRENGTQDAWGNYRFPAELTASRNRFGFTGYYFDSETDLYYAKARYFDPAFGRFLTQDSYLGEISDPPSLHRYFYANANPTRYVDPSGYNVFDLASQAFDKLKAAADQANSAVKGFVAAAQSRYNEARAEVTTMRHGVAPQGSIGTMDVAGQMLRNLDRDAGAPSLPGELGRAQRFGQSYAVNALASVMQMPAGAQSVALDAATPGGTRYWTEGSADTSWAPARRQQVAALGAAADSNRSLLERGTFAALAVLSTPVTIVESMTTAPGARSSDALGQNLYEAGAAAQRGDFADAGLRALEAGQQGVEAFVALGTLAAPLSGKGTPLGRERLYRAVQPAELQDIRSTGVFRNPEGIEVKYFSTTDSGARQYSTLAERAFNDGPYTIVETSLPKAQIKPEMRVTVDRGIQTVTVPTGKLPHLRKPVIK